MNKSALYTKTGDAGATSLLGGDRVFKSDSRLFLYGEVDCLNSMLGFALSLIDKKQVEIELIEYIEQIQSDLFVLGSNLAAQSLDRDKFKLRQFTNNDIMTMEGWIDKLDELVNPLKNFILPGGNPAAAYVQVCRAECRSVERLLVSFDQADSEEVPVLSLKYINRLSDFLFVCGRYLNKLANNSEVIWKG